jgi:nitrogen-specific signal transduction histidine kinase
MYEGGQLRIRIRLSHSWDASDTSGFRVVVADTGTGIAPDFLPRVLNGFTTTKNPTGTGLGQTAPTNPRPTHSKPGCWPLFRNTAMLPAH